MTSNIASHEAAQKRLWKKEQRELLNRANQIVAGQVRATRTARTEVSVLEKDLAKARKELERLQKNRAGNAELTKIETRLAALRGRIEA